MASSGPLTPLLTPLLATYLRLHSKERRLNRVNALWTTMKVSTILWQQGLIPVHQAAARVTPRRISEQNVAN